MEFDIWLRTICRLEMLAQKLRGAIEFLHVKVICFRQGKYAQNREEVYSLHVVPLGTMTTKLQV